MHDSLRFSERRTVQFGDPEGPEQHHGGRFRDRGTRSPAENPGQVHQDRPLPDPEPEPGDKNSEERPSSGAAQKLGLACYDKPEHIEYTEQGNLTADSFPALTLEDKRG